MRGLVTADIFDLPPFEVKELETLSSRNKGVWMEARAFRSP
jgi:hypothetical protein